MARLRLKTECETTCEICYKKKVHVPYVSAVVKYESRVLHATNIRSPSVGWSNLSVAPSLNRHHCATTNTQIEEVGSSGVILEDMSIAVSLQRIGILVSSLCSISSFYNSILHQFIFREATVKCSRYTRI